MKSKIFTPQHFNKIKKLKSYFVVSKNGAGFTLLEVIVAVFVVTVGLIGIFIVIQNISTYTSYSNDSLIASYLAQEGMEIVRNIRDTNWLEEENNPNPDQPIPWNEGLLNVCSDSSGGCEVDYTTPTVEKPSLSSFGVGRNLKIDSTNGFYNYTSGINTKFKRRIIINNPNDYTLEVKVLVYRQDKKMIEVLEKLYNWKEY